jgi:cytochrome c oxidase accessory protein FixG
VAQDLPRAERTRRRRPDLDTVYTINQDGSRNFLHPADVKGRWQGRKNWIFLILIVIYAGLPWIQIGGNPAVHFDIPGRRAFLFGQTFTNQDTYLLFFLVTGMGFALFVVTALWGRIWCGYACPQTVFLEGVFRRIERWIEGPRDTRIRRNAGPMTTDKLWRKSVKHLVFVALSVLVSHVFIAYFIPARELAGVIGGNPGQHMSAFLWIVGMSGILYFDYAWFREQTCVVVCPYGRLQSALIDQDTILIGYDKKRGEPRSKAAESGGDCIDCYRCVAVCPTGIDIRNGLQMECIGCANCIDACDEVMARTDRPRGLIRYDSLRGFEAVRRGWLRPRVFLYAALGLVGLAVAGVTASKRTTFEVRALRTRGLPYTIGETSIQNLVNLDLQNKEGEARTYLLRSNPAAGAPAGLDILIPEKSVRLAGFGQTIVPIFITVPRDAYEAPFPIGFVVEDSLSGDQRKIDLRFLGP